MAKISAPVSTACFLWKTERPFSDISRKSCEFPFLGAKWWFEAKLHSVSGVTYYSISLKKRTGTVSKRNNINITAIVNFAILSFEGVVCNKYDVPVQTCSQINIWKYPEKELCFSNGAWEIICVFHDVLSPELKIENIKVDSSTQIDTDLSTSVEKCTQVSQAFSDLEKLSDDFSNLLRQSLYYPPDAKLRCGDLLVPIHSSVLAARSPVFNAMLRDQSTDTFNVTDLDVKTLNLLLEYVYSGTIQELSDSDAISLHGAGKAYTVDSLTKACSEWMIEHMTEQNCVSFLEAGNATDDGSLVEAVASFLRDHPDVFKSPSWDRFAAQQMSLSYKLIHKVYVSNS